jgi:hypothetical protein
MANINFRSIVDRQWRGENPLRFSLAFLGVIVVLFARALDFTIRSIERQFWNHADPYYVALAGLSAYYVVLAPIFVVWLGGSFRSAVRNWKSQSPAISFLSIICVFLVALGISSLYLKRAPSEFQDVLSAINGDPEWGEGSVTVGSDEAQIYLKGSLTRSLYSKFETILDGDKSAAVVNLEGSGGRVDAALKIRDIIVKRNLDTYVSGKCTSACSILFLSGRNRSVGPNAKIGFHSPAIGTSESISIIESWMDYVASQGVSRQFLERAYSTPSTTMWYPSISELKAAGAINKDRSENQN